jgi:hypothetical protein
LPSAVAWSSTSWQVATIAGPGVGGVLYSGLAGLLGPETPGGWPTAARRYASPAPVLLFS